MNTSMIRYMLGKLLIILGLLMLPSFALTFVYHEALQVQLSFVYAILLCILIGSLVSRKKPENEDFYAQESLVLVALAWIALSVAGALPFYFSGDISFIDALFESFSGFTTTGASVLKTTIYTLPHSLLFGAALP